MPIYAYRCATCGHAQDVLQKISDPVLTVCPACGNATYQKQVTAAGFQLKGSGWYVTDFRGDKKAAKPADGAPEGGDKADKKGEGSSTAEKASGEGAAAKTDAAAPAASPASAPAAAPSPAPAPAAPTPSSPTGKTGG